RNVIRRAVLMTSDVVRPEHLAGVYADSLPASSPSAHGASPSGLSLKEIADIAAQQVERQAIRLSPSSRALLRRLFSRKKPRPHPRQLARPTCGGQESEKRQPTCQVRARDQCVVRSLQTETLHERGKEPSRGSAARSRHPVGPERQKILLPEGFM